MNSENTYILTINTGSSSIKFSLFNSVDEQFYVRGEISGIGYPVGLFIIEDDSRNDIFREERRFRHHEDAFKRITDWLRGKSSELAIQCVGHRVVHGGTIYGEPVVIDDSVVNSLETLVEYDPLHLTSEVDGIKLCKKVFPEAIHVACFDTAFHRTIPEVVFHLPISRGLQQTGIRRYGFHGLSYEYIQQSLESDESCGRTIIAHLGSGASIAALKNGKSVDTSMGFTTNSGLVMSTRSGDLDPGLILYLQETLNLSSDELRRKLSRESGLKGISGISGDMKELLDKEQVNASAHLAIEIFCYTVKKYIGAYAAALGGVETLVFTGGIGERSAPIRERVCEGLTFLGITLDSERNNRHASLISTDSATVNVRVIPTNEELMIARHTNKLAVSV